MAEQDKHFGSDLGLDPATSQTVLQFMLDHAADRHQTEAAFKIDQSVPKDAAPQRITETRYWIRKHREIAAVDWARAAVKNTGQLVRQLKLRCRFGAKPYGACCWQRPAFTAVQPHVFKVIWPRQPQPPVGDANDAACAQLQGHRVRCGQFKVFDLVHGRAKQVMEGSRWGPGQEKGLQRIKATNNHFDCSLRGSPLETACWRISLCPNQERWVWKTLGEAGPPVVNVNGPRYGALLTPDRRLTGFNNIELITDRDLELNLKEIAEVKRLWPDRAMVVSLMVPCVEDAWKAILPRVEDTGCDLSLIHISEPTRPY